MSGNTSNVKKINISTAQRNGMTVSVNGDSLDEIIDTVAAMKDIEFAQYLVDRYKDLTTSQFKKLIPILLKTNDLREVIDLVYYPNRACLPEIMEELINWKDKTYKCFQNVAEYLSDYDDGRVYIPKMEDALIEVADCNYIRRFGQIQGANINKLQEAIIKIGNAEEIREFTKEHLDKAIDIIALQNAISKTGDYNEIMKFAYEIDQKGIGVEVLQNTIIESGDIYWIFEFADRIKGADVDKAIKKLEELGDREYVEELKKKMRKNE